MTAWFRSSLSQTGRLESSMSPGFIDTDPTPSKSMAQAATSASKRLPTDPESNSSATNSKRAKSRDTSLRLTCRRRLRRSCNSGCQPSKTGHPLRRTSMTAGTSCNFWKVATRRDGKVGKSRFKRRMARPFHHRVRPPHHPNPLFLPRGKKKGASRVSLEVGHCRASAS